MAFSKPFQSFVCEGDKINTDVDGFLVTARIVRDDCPDAPDQRQDGFWPSIYKDAPGFIGPGSGWRDRFEAAQVRATDIMRAWHNDEWFYCGIILSVSIEEIVLDTHAASLWGIEANYPSSDNSYLTETATELLSDALTIGRATVARLCNAQTVQAAR